MIGLLTAERILEEQKTDLRLDRSRCLRSRFRKNDCLECSKACVNQAMTVEGGKISRDEDRCKGCLLCVSNCPSDAISWEKSWHWNMIDTVKKNAKTLLGCQKSLTMDSHIKVPCLGMFSEAFLMALFFSIDKPVNIDATFCSECENRHIMPVFEQRLSNIAEKLDISITDRICLLREKSQVKEMQREVGRRKFFGDLKNIIVPNAQRTRTPKFDPSATIFSLKKQPPNTELLFFAVLQAPTKIRDRVLKHYFFSIDVAPQCKLCGGCAAMCPTGALKLKREEHGKQLHFRMFNCNGCHLCQEFCKQKAISVRAGKEKTMPVADSKLYSEPAESSIEILNHNYSN